ncbi:GspH/FimT family pseudopilin [Cupriavidus pauculus]|uniref:Type II secretion system protein H n=1 Tax=Cupriavidus pauculus TaxID=82633 RepID=A0A2N5CH69_9BURK|nr:GspH/FimT family pseudopilin [Cupriavidus pauculus]PLQ01590.1 pilus assembly protein FimT [Cupriavidus pauculus]
MTSRTSTLPRHGGFTLIELLTTMAVAIVIIGFAVPSMTTFVKNQRLLTAADSLNVALTKARTVAAASNSYVTVAPIDGDWKKGWRLFNEHAAPNGQYEAANDTLIAVYDPLPDDIKYAYDATNGLGYISFSPIGYSQTADKTQMAMAIMFTLGSAQRMVEVSLLGRSRVCTPVAQDPNGYCTMPKISTAS